MASSSGRGGRELLRLRVGDQVAVADWGVRDSELEHAVLTASLPEDDRVVVG